MTHKDIYTKFMIEYDKANVTSSYPSLTEYEVATVLDKAYNALIAQKITGNNVRRSTFESDVKSIADLEPLVKTKPMVIKQVDGINVACGDYPTDMLYYINSYLYAKGYPANLNDTYNPLDKIITRRLPAKLVPHQVADKFIVNSFNIPWIKDPVCYMEGGKCYFVYDPIKQPILSLPSTSTSDTVVKTDPDIQVIERLDKDVDNSPKEGNAQIVYIKRPNKFVKDLTKPEDGWVSYFDWSSEEVPTEYQFECNDTVAEELISLAVAFALENVESQRLSTKLNMRGLEA